jgi:hypothetical protein
VTGQVRERADGFEIRRSAPRAPLRIVVLAAALAFWALGERFAAGELSAAGPGDAGVLRLALVLWTLGGALLAWRLLGALFSRDRLVVAGGAVALGRELFGLGRRRRFTAARVRAVAAEAQPPDLLDLAWGVRVWGVGGAALVFELGGERVRWAEGIDEGEAGELAELLRARGLGEPAQSDRLTAST